MFIKLVFGHKISYFSALPDSFERQARKKVMELKEKEPTWNGEGSGKS